MEKKPKLELLVGSWHLLRQIMAFGNPSDGGFATMEEALLAVATLNKELEAECGVSLAVSGHLWHEILVPGDDPKIGYSAQWNNPRGIDLDTWIRGAQDGRFAPIGRVIPPGFGLPGSDSGNLINPDPKRRQLAHDAMVFSFAQSQRVKREGAGKGEVIFWTGPDGIRWQRLVNGDDPLLGYGLNEELEEWKLIVQGLAAAIKEAREAGYVDEILLIEGKEAGDPCYLDVMTDTHLAVRLIKAINELVGAPVAKWQGEFCHTRGGGETFANGIRIAIEGDVFGGHIHFNSGPIASQRFTNLLSVIGGTRMSKFQQYVDPDYLPGEGVPEWITDQEDSLAVLKCWALATGEPAQVEFDARFCRYADTIGALRKSALWTVKAFNAA